ncbi:MAG TPA: glycosyl hydrolase family 65 protein [Caulobacteraceae bacterium]|nr:glycosyl hydrolase family 65 protein [Caulobacteraceae bacterium]
MREAAQADDSGEGWTISHAPERGLAEAGWRARLSLSNGFLGAQASSPFWQASLQADAPRAYVAGAFAPGPAGTPALVGMPDRLILLLSIDGKPVMADGGAFAWRRMLDLSRGVLALSCDLNEAETPLTHLRVLRLLSLADRNLDLQLTALGFSRATEVTLEARWRNERAAGPGEELADGARLWRGERHAIARASHASLHVDGGLLEPERTPSGWRWRWRSAPGQHARLEAISAFARADSPGADAAGIARAACKAAASMGRVDLIAGHNQAWDERWLFSEVEVGGDPAARQALRFAVYHLNSAANPSDPAVSIGARGLTGDTYNGHVFWDTEAFALAFYTLTWPDAARTLLGYRYRGLAGARAKAARLGWRGAFYAWESADTGDEAAPSHTTSPTGRDVDIYSGRNEAHISADIALATWRYWRATGDDAFFQEQGAEILLETARFWASRARLEADGAHHIRGVEGPDEYHEDVDDNAFTNVMARWNLRRGLETATVLRSRWPDRFAALSAALQLQAEELTAWKAIADTLVTGLDRRSGVYEQFAGFFKLERIDLSAYRSARKPMDVILGAERTTRAQVIKQPDVVALMSRLPDLFGRVRGLANFRAYEPLCAHGSSLSEVTHALVAARLGERETALRYFREAAEIDLGPDAARSAGGLHIAALGGLWQTAVFGFGGMAGRGGGLVFDPRLPPGWTSLAFPIRWRGRLLRIVVEPDRFQATLEDGEPMPIRIAGRGFHLTSAAPLVTPLRS